MDILEIAIREVEESPEDDANTEVTINGNYICQ